MGADAATVDPNSISHNNFIDDAIFNRMAKDGIQSAPLTTDAEFIRRVTLDLTGRIPTAAQVQAFIADTTPNKRDMLIDSLIGSPEFVDKWTMFLGDLYKNNANATNINRFPQGRDSLYHYLHDSVAANKPYNEMASELISATGDNLNYGPAGWVAGTNVAGGPAQDIYDGGAVQVASMFLGINSVDCLLCHNGARHLDTVNLWGSQQLRQNMWGLSAYFSRTRIGTTTITQTPLLQSHPITDVATGAYALNTTTGNRSARQPIMVNGVTVNTINPKNPFTSATGSGVLQGETYRQALARQITADPQFARAAVNYIWEKFMVEAFVSPSNAFDLARLDPLNPPADPWTLQPTNPELLNEMASRFQSVGYDIRVLMSWITKSNAYQLSSAYPDTWDINWVPYYARHYVRRLDAEEVHDAITRATNVLPTYTFTSGLPSVQWAMQLPDTKEGQGSAAFLNSFGRGDRDTNMRRSDGSVLQGLNMMNNTFVMNRIHQNNAGSRVQSLLAQTSDPTTIIQQLFLNTLSRPATDDEVAYFRPTFQQQGTRTATEGLQWILLNRLQFLFNY